MRMFMRGIVGVVLGLTLLSGGAAVAMAHGASTVASTATRLQASPPASQACAQDQADTGTEAAAENTVDTDQVQDTTSPDTGNDANKQADPDNIDLQCGDQTGPDTEAGSAQTGGTPVTGQIQAQVRSLLAAKTSHATSSVLARRTIPAANPSGNGQSEATGSEGETNQGNDVATDHVLCDQQGQNEGNNTGC